MIDQIISFETAKLAKDKGLISGLWCEGVYCVGYGGIEENYSFLSTPSRQSVKGQFHLALAPTQSLLAKWLREKHNTHVNCVFSTAGGIIRDFGKGMYFWGVIEFPQLDKKVECFETYEEALEKDKNIWILKRQRLWH